MRSEEGQREREKRESLKQTPRWVQSPTWYSISRPWGPWPEPKPRAGLLNQLYYPGACFCIFWGILDCTLDIVATLDCSILQRILILFARLFVCLFVYFGRQLAELRCPTPALGGSSNLHSVEALAWLPQSCIDHPNIQGLSLEGVSMANFSFSTSYSKISIMSCVLHISKFPSWAYSKKAE